MRGAPAMIRIEDVVVPEFVKAAVLEGTEYLRAGLRLHPWFGTEPRALEMRFS
jgi:hypothetical protein